MKILLVTVIAAVCFLALSSAFVAAAPYLAAAVMIGAVWLLLSKGSKTPLE